MLLSAEHLSINFGDRQLLDDVDFYLNEGDRVGIIGVNGTGKSTLLRLLAGELSADGGRIARNPNVQVSYLPQNPTFDETATVLEQVFLHLSPAFREAEEYEAKTILTQLGIEDFTRVLGDLSGGERRRVALAAALLHPAEVLVLDEPTNHLDAEMVSWLEDRLSRFRGGLVMVTHDRYFLERVTNHITELSRGKLYHYEANFSKYLELKAQRQEMDEASERKRQSILRVEREWIMRGCRARSTKSRDRIERYEALKDQSSPESDAQVQMATAAKRLGRKTIELEHVSKTYGDRTVIRDFTYGLSREDRIGIVGRNGAGKTTLLRMVLGELAPDSGTVEQGATVKIGYFSQEGRELDLDQRVYDFVHQVAEEVHTREGMLSASSMMERFLFPPEMQPVKIGRLSGGERRRLRLLAVLMEAPNVLLLDEPTNDLDITTLAVLEDYLEDFPGAVMAVSHDRFFLDRMAEDIFAVGLDGSVTRYTGNYSDYAEKRREEERPVRREEKSDRDQVRPQSKKLKFSFHEQREFETIDEDVAALEQQLKTCVSAQGSAGSDYVRLQELQAQQEVLEAQLEEKTERWVYLNELAQRIEEQK